MFANLLIATGLVLLIGLPIYLILGAAAYPVWTFTEKHIDKAVDKLCPTPIQFQKQQEVYDVYLDMLRTGHNRRGVQIASDQVKNNVSRCEACYQLIKQDIQDMGIDFNWQYAMELCGLDTEIKLRDGYFRRNAR